MAEEKQEAASWAANPRAVSLRMAAVQAPAIPLVGDLIRANPGTISLGQGVVSYGPPPQAIERLRDFLADPEHHKYQAVHGIPSLLEMLERKLLQENGVRVGPERALVVTAGGNMGFVNAVLAIADPGDEVIITLPYYFNHEMAIAIAGAFYLLINVPTSCGAMALIERLVREHRVAVMPGSTFGVMDRCALRVSYGALTEETAAEGAQRLIGGLRTILGK